MSSGNKKPVRDLFGVYRIGTVELNQWLKAKAEAHIYGLVMKSYTLKAALVQNWWARHFHQQHRIKDLDECVRFGTVELNQKLNRKIAELAERPPKRKESEHCENDQKSEH